MAEAPTGTGKTLAALFPTLKAIPRTNVDKIFYLTAKTTGKHLALENIQLIANDKTARVPLRTLGLPHINPINEHLRQVMQDQFGQGYDFTYTYPGIQKVIQAAGRVIRTTSDEGYVWLLDQRYQLPHIQNLLPQWWGMKPPS